RAMGGDVSGPPQALTVNRIAGRTVTGAQPSGGQALGWNSSSSQWEPQSHVTTFAGRSGAVTAQAGDYIAAQVSNAADKTAANIFIDGAIQTFPPSASVAGIRIVPGLLPSAGVVGDLAIDSSDSRLKVFDGLSWGALAPSQGGVTSFAGRTGAVTPQAGDYTAAQGRNAADKSAANAYGTGGQ